LPSVVSPRPRPSPLFPYTTLFRSYFYGGRHRYNYNWRSAVLLWLAEFFHVHRADAEPHPFHYILRSAVVKVAVLADINRNAWPGFYVPGHSLRPLSAAVAWPVDNNPQTFFWPAVQHRLELSLETGRDSLSRFQYQP